MIKKSNFNLHKKIIIGTAQFSKNYGIVKKKNQNPYKFINLVKKYKLKAFDTSVNYKGSINLIETNTKDSNLIIKLSTRNYNGIIPILKFKKQVNLISKKIKKNKIYSFMIHDFSLSYCKKINNHINFLIEFCKENKIRFGFSIYKLSEFNYIKKYDFNILQVPINVFNREFLNYKFIRFVKSKKIEIHARSIFLQGMLLSDVSRVPKKFKYLKKPLTYFESWIKMREISKLYACLKYILSFSIIDKIVLGTNNYLQFKQTIETIEKINGKLNIPKQLKNISHNQLNPKNW